jgi:hypothetical protein
MNKRVSSIKIKIKVHCNKEKIKKYIKTLSWGGGAIFFYEFLLLSGDLET